MRRAEPVAKLDHFGLRGKPEVLKERSRNLRRAGEFFSSKGLAGRQREAEIAGMWRGRVHDFKILTELDEAVPKNLTKKLCKKDWRSRS